MLLLVLLMLLVLLLGLLLRVKLWLRSHYLGWLRLMMMRDRV
jgi:hypothetical protein